MILDNLSAHKGETIRHWAARHRVELCFTPTYASWANPIEAHFGPLRQFTIANSHHPNHTARPGHCTPTCAGATTTPATPTSWPPQRRERARVRSEKGIRWGGRPLTAAT